MADVTASQLDAATRDHPPGSHPDLPPPMLVSGPVAWLKRNLFSSIGNTVLTLVVLYLLYLAVPAFIRWALLDANWNSGDSRAACEQSGACWTMVRARIGQFIYGFYPADQRWRINLVFLIFAVTVAALLIERVKGKRYWALFFFVGFPIITYLLLVGGPFLPLVQTSKWGGLMLTLVVAVVGIVFSIPLGVILALGRQSTLPAIHMLCVIFIEFVRGVPLITILFMANVMLPLFLPKGVTFDIVLRILIGVTLFSAAYIAEVVRGGLQAMPKGQYEGAQAMGLGYWQMMRLIILPQALRISIPGIVNSSIGLFMDTTLVAIVGLFDFLNIIKASTKDQNWLGLSMEGYVFAAAVYWVFCFGMSRYSQYLERKLHTGHKR